MPSIPTIVNRFGGWDKAVCLAGCRTRSGAIHRADRTPREGCVIAVADCAADLGHTPSYSEYDRWARERGAPSAQLVRIRCGSWFAAAEECDSLMQREWRSAA